MALANFEKKTLPRPSTLDIAHHHDVRLFSSSKHVWLSLKCSCEHLPSDVESLPVHRHLSLSVYRPKHGLIATAIRLGVPHKINRAESRFGDKSPGNQACEEHTRA
jgi:hypothetical protein